MHNIFHMSLLDHNITKKKRIDKPTFLLTFETNDKNKK